MNRDIKKEQARPNFFTRETPGVAPSRKSKKGTSTRPGGARAVQARRRRGSVLREDSPQGIIQTAVVCSVYKWYMSRTSSLISSLFASRGRFGGVEMEG